MSKRNSRTAGLRSRGMTKLLALMRSGGWDRGYKRTTLTKRTRTAAYHTLVGPVAGTSRAASADTDAPEPVRSRTPVLPEVGTVRSGRGRNWSSAAADRELYTVPTRYGAAAIVPATGGRVLPGQRQGAKSARGFRRAIAAGQVSSTVVAERQSIPTDQISVGMPQARSPDAVADARSTPAAVQPLYPDYSVAASASAWLPAYQLPARTVPSVSPIAASPSAVSPASGDGAVGGIGAVLAPSFTQVGLVSTERPFPGNGHSPVNSEHSTIGAIHLDGSALGQWVTRHLERSLAQPDRGPSGIDPRVTPIMGPASAGY
jgi:hypothetical protein